MQFSNDSITRKGNKQSGSGGGLFDCSNTQVQHRCLVQFGFATAVANQKFIKLQSSGKFEH